MNKRTLLLIILLTLSLLNISKAQNPKSATFIGLNPSVTVEPYYNKGELDINVFPLVYQKTISKRIDFRFSATVNYGIRDSASNFSHLGFQAAFPIFIFKKDEKFFESKGLYIAPGLGFTRNLMEKHTNLGFWIEPGYNLLIAPKWSISFGLQLGATHFWYDNGNQKTGSHFGIKIIFGHWLI